MRFILWRDKLLLLTLGLFFFAHSTYLRVLIRSVLEGPSFGWAYFAGLKRDGALAQVAGKGLYGDTGYILAQAFVVGLLLVLGLRRPDRLFTTALFIWTSLDLSLSWWVLTQSSEAITVSKETLGMVDVPANWTMLLWPGLAWLGSLLLVARGLVRSKPVVAASWTRANTMLTVAAAVALAASALLLNLGEQHGPLDFTGIGLIYMGLILAFAGLSPWGPGPRADRELP